MFDNFNLPLRLLKGRVTFKNSIILSNLLKHEGLSYLDNDSVLRDLMNDAVIFFTDSKQINTDTALEKIANSLERVKTILEVSDKKKSTEKIIELLSKDADIRRFLGAHLKELNIICNNHLIRHKEVNQKSLDSEELKQFLFYEFFNVIRFILKKIDQKNNNGDA